MEDAEAYTSHHSVKGTRLLRFSGAGILLLCALVYSVALQGPLFFDDEPNLLANPQVQIDGKTLDEWRSAALSSYASILYRPVAMLTFAVNHVVVGAFTPFSLKATNLAIHGVIAVLVFLLSQVLLRTPALRAHRLSACQRDIVALVAAAIWLLHPIHVPTVLYAVQRMAQLSTLFVLVGLLVFTHYRLRWADSGGGFGEVLAAMLWLVLLAILAVLSKENGALLPWLVVVVEVVLFRGAWSGTSRRPLVWLGWVALLLPVLVILAAYIVAPEILQDRYGGRDFTLGERLLTQGRVLWQYLGWMLFPNVLSMGFFHDDILVSRSLWAPFTTSLALLAWIVVLIATLVWHRRYPLIAFAILFYLVAHSMESTVLPLEMVFEHRNYLPGTGFALLASVGLFRCVALHERLRPHVVIGGVLCVLAALLLVRTTAWSDEVSLARFNVINHPQSPRANFFYGNALFKRFLQAEALDLDEEETRALAVAARGYFEKMREMDENSFSALVMLYQLDTLYFPGLGEENDWLDAMMQSAKVRRLQSSDHTALGALVDFSQAPAAAQGRDRVGSLLTLLASRYPGHIDLVSLKQRFVMATTPAQKPTLLPLLERAQQMNPANPHASTALVQYYGSGDLANSYEAIREWMRRDHLRRDLPVLRAMFEQQ